MNNKKIVEAKSFKDYKYQIYADYGNGMKIAAWYDDEKKAKKEAESLKAKGYTVKIVEK